MLPYTTQKKKEQLRNTFICILTLIACVPILGLGTVSLVSITNSHKNNISELEHQTLTSSKEVVSLFFHTITETLSTNFDTLDKETLSIATSSWQEVYAKKFAMDNKAILEVSFVNLQGKEIAKYSKINSSNIPLYLSEFSLFKKALTGAIAIGDVHTTSHGQAVTIAVPSKVNGQIFNIVIAEVSLSPLITSIEKIRLGKNGQVFLFDNNGTHIGAELGSIKKNALVSSWKRLNETLEGNSFDGRSPFDRYESPLLNTPVIGSALKLDDINWALFVEWPTIEADILVENFRNIVLFSVFISIILVLLVASLLSNFLVRPIKLLQDAANEIEKGNFEKQVMITTNNELEELGEAFNKMSTGLKRLEELKNEFVYVAAHELRAPVTAIKGYMELVFDGNGGSLSPELERLLTPVKRSNERLVNLVNDLLKVARSEAGKLEIAIAPSDIRVEVLAILDEIKPLAGKRNISVNYIPLDTLPLVMVNTGSFKEIIMNFVSNAVKYGNYNGNINVSHEIKDGYVTTSIADDGRGMSEEDQKHLFQKFFRAGDVKKTSIEGTGLGLFITKELVEKMGGKLSVTSTLGVGTTFTVAFKHADTSLPSAITIEDQTSLQLNS